MKYEVSGRDIILYEPDLILDEVLDTGQAFSWERLSENRYQGYCLDCFLDIEGSDGKFVLKNTAEDVFLKVWVPYFDLETDYSPLRSLYSEDKTLDEACRFSRGIRLLNQDGWEALISFIFSSNNNITRIKGIISRLREHYGHFPTPDELSDETVESLGYLRSGFRARYVIDAAKKVSGGEISLDEIKKMPYEEAHKTLQKICGVGPKVADCVLLCGFRKTEAFPMDVWMKRVIAHFYADGFPQKLYPTRGIAQLYLFNYIRKAGISLDDGENT